MHFLGQSHARLFGLKLDRLSFGHPVPSEQAAYSGSRIRPRGLGASRNDHANLLKNF